MGAAGGRAVGVAVSARRRGVPAGEQDTAV